MDDDIIVVDDGEVLPSQAGPSKVNGFGGISESSAKPSPTGTGERHSSRLRTTSAAARAAMDAANERTTRSTSVKNKPPPKLKLKLSEKAAAQAPGMSFLGQYDRELDSDDEELAFEEQFILRMPAGEDCEKLRKMVAARELPNDVWFKFKDSRRGVLHIGNSTYTSKLVDLPCIIESQKTLDNKQMFKVADICQMLVVENRIENEDAAANQRSFNIEEFIWPHGITPPLHHVRKRRFRKRINRRTIESVEQAVERLLEEDSLATEVKYEVLENVNPDLSDSEFIEREAIDAATPAISDLGDAATPGGDMGEYEGEGDEEEEEEPDGDIDEELAAELDLALGDEEQGDGDEDEDDEDDESEEDEDDEDDEEAQARKLLNEEIRDLEAAVAKKGNEIASSSNPLIRKRFEDALKKLTYDLETKIAQRDDFRRYSVTASLTSDGDGNDDGDMDQGGDGPMEID
ncbi:TAFII55 protein conserved region-domain-containing protein [Armillaria luteobubalina]|uniref:TAFII55 protein conserved region-domain-containing protein n=1 Tax=Armillaria luteobubalina TaxID=153913 RepID=A0AA39QCG4_9AGAR|nr:TAFII55 protein conserved region-domain-containing protein [Armillaria luteobubalina]